MDKPKFRKGPWRVYDCRGYDETSHEFSVVDKEGWNIADVTDMIESEENKANAALIAAAPEMYAMLEDMLNMFAEESVEYGMIQKLLVKARGEL